MYMKTKSKANAKRWSEEMSKALASTDQSRKDEEKAAAERKARIAMRLRSSGLYR